MGQANAVSPTSMEGSCFLVVHDECSAEGRGESERREVRSAVEEVSDVAPAAVVGVELQAGNDALFRSAHRRPARYISSSSSSSSSVDL